MAGDWIKMRADLFTHPKVVRITSALKADTLRTVGGLMSVWCLFDTHSVDGNLEGYTFDAVDNHLRWDGFSEAMRSVGWLEETPEGLVLPRFDTHNGQSAKRRAQDSDRKREGRKASALEADKTRTREEKRREEIPPTNVGGGAAPKKSRALKNCPADFVLTDEMRGWAAEHAPAVNADLATSAFKDHTFSRGITDWPGAWRNWLRRDQQAAKPTNRTAQHSLQSFAQADEMARRKRWEEMTGRKWPTSGDVIEMETDPKRIAA